MSEKHRRGPRGGVVVAALVALAVIKELRTPAEERTWEGRLFGFVPYDLRMPTLQRLRDAWFNPDDPRLLTPRPFGVGWAVNFGRFVPSD